MDYLHCTAFSNFFFKVLFLISSNDSQGSDTNSMGYMDLLRHTNPPLCFMASICSQAWRNASDPFIRQLTSGYQGLPASSFLSFKETNAPDAQFPALQHFSHCATLLSFQQPLLLQQHIFLLFTFQILDCTLLLSSYTPSSPICSFYCSVGWFFWFGKVNSMRVSLYTIHTHWRFLLSFLCLECFSSYRLSVSSKWAGSFTFSINFSP